MAAGLGAAGAARGAEQEVVGLDAGFEQVELALGEADVGEAGLGGAGRGRGDGAGEGEKLGGFVVHEGIWEGVEVAGEEVGFGFEHGVLAEEGEGAEQRPAVSRMLAMRVARAWFLAAVMPVVLRSWRRTQASA